MKRVWSILMTIVMLAGMSGMHCFAASTDDWIITNPYAAVDWDSWTNYKFQPHCHTNVSDGYPTIHEFVQTHYDMDYDIVALTDHGTLNRGWNRKPDLIPLVRRIKKERTKLADIYPLTDEEYNAVLTGTAKSETRTHKNGMLDVPLGLELNMATPFADCHLTGYFSEYGQGLAGVFGDYETPTKGVKDAGGISMLSHVGEYVYVDKDSEDHVGQKIDEYYVNKFARLFMDNVGSSVGMGINSATDAHTRCDRILYDQILQKTIPNGVVPWGFCFADSHSAWTSNDAWTELMMDRFDLTDMRRAMVEGTSFAVSHYSNGFELNGMQEMPGYSDDLALWDDPDYYLSNETPKVTRITVDEQKDTITVEGKNFDAITWVSDGEVIRREENIRASAEGGTATATLDLHARDLLRDPSLYVRFYITGKYGICYAQPFVIRKAGTDFTPVYVPKTHDISTFLRGLVTVLDWTLFKWSPIIWAFKYFALGYNPVQRLWSEVTAVFTGKTVNAAGNRIR